MGDTLFIIKVVTSIFLPLWLYIWISSVVKKKLSHLGFEFKFPNVQFLLKRWWAECCINLKKRKQTNSHNNKMSHLESLKNIKNNDSISSLLFYGADQKGNSLFIKFSHKRFKIVEVSLQFTTSEGDIYVLPVYPDTTIINSLNPQWTAPGLKIETLEFQQRWRIVYNGMLRNVSRENECNDTHFQHIRFNFIFIAYSQPLKWPDDWSSKLHANALAREPWRSPEWINKIQRLDYSGLDYLGSMLGQVTFKDNTVSTLYLRGLHQHRWGEHESQEFNKCVTLFGVMQNGALYYLSAGNTKHSFPRILFGQFKHSNEKICRIDNIGLELDDFTLKNFITTFQNKMWFTAEDVKYNIHVKCNNPITLYHGQPWNWLNRIATAKLEMNGKTGFGLLQLWQPYDATNGTKITKKLPYLKQVNVNIQKNDYVIYINDKKCQNENIVGGKGCSLAMLTAIEDIDFVVPRGFCVTVFALELQLHTHKELQNIIDNIENICVGKKEGDLQKYCCRAAHAFESTPINGEVRGAILQAVKALELPNDEGTFHSYAIRSSAIGEDSEATSAAGQNATYLGVQGADNIIKCLVKCWASLFSYQSIKYRKQHGMLIKASMGVCIQQMVNPNAAGVMFTRHPTTGDPSSIVITANYGLGETVVSAMVEPDTILVNRTWDNKLTIKNVMLGSKKQKIVAANDGVVTTNLKNEENEKICISEETALRLAAVGLQLENVFCNPRDIEWAITDEQIYLLQARPITSLFAWTDFELTHELDTGVPNDDEIITFANAAEVFPYPVSPLTRSIVIPTFNETIITTYRIHYRQFFHIVGLKFGINYTNTFLRKPNKSITFLNKIADISVAGSVLITPEIHAIACEKNGVSSSSDQLLLLCKTAKELIQNSSVAESSKKISQCLTLNAEDFYTTSSLHHEINKKFEEFRNVVYFHMHTSRVSIMYQIFVMTLLTKGYTDLIQDHFTDIANLLSCCNDIVGTELLSSLNKIVNSIKEDKKDKDFKKLHPTKAINWLKINCPMAAKELGNFLKKHGHRCIQEMDFLAEPWSLKPENIITTLQSMMISMKENPTREKFSIEETVASLKTPKSRTTRWLLKKIVPFCRKAVAQRELTKSSFVRVLHTFRLAYKRLGRLMVLEGYLPSEDLIFYLTKEEIAQIFNYYNPTIVQKACRRKRILPRLKDLQYPEHNTGIPIPVQNNVDVTLRDENVKIHGMPVFVGSVLSRACVITDLSEAEMIQPGDILITHSTDIAWSPYFPLLSGIVTELGGLISHGAVVAREYGLPCIIGAKRATTVFQTGDTVLLVADAGVVQLVNKCENKIK